jgi:hypothetical protein
MAGRFFVYPGFLIYFLCISYLAGSTLGMLLLEPRVIATVHIL